MKGAVPYVGSEGIVETVEEERVEVLCRIDILPKVLKAVRKVHPYEEPAIDIYPVLMADTIKEEKL